MSKLERVGITLLNSEITTETPPVKRNTKDKKKKNEMMYDK